METFPCRPWHFYSPAELHVCLVYSKLENMLEKLLPDHQAEWEDHCR